MWHRLWGSFHKQTRAPELHGYEYSQYNLLTRFATGINGQ